MLRIEGDEQVQIGPSWIEITLARSRAKEVQPART
jgi:hypothetical protein